MPHPSSLFLCGWGHVCLLVAVSCRKKKIKGFCLCVLLFFVNLLFNAHDVLFLTASPLPHRSQTIFVDARRSSTISIICFYKNTISKYKFFVLLFTRQLCPRNVTASSAPEKKHMDKLIFCHVRNQNFRVMYLYISNVAKIMTFVNTQ